MNEFIKPVAEWCAATTEILGVFVIVLFAFASVLMGIVRLLAKTPVSAAFRQVHTVAVELTYRSVGVLAIIVLIRTFLSFTLDVDLMKTLHQSCAFTRDARYWCVASRVNAQLWWIEKD